MINSIQIIAYHGSQTSNLNLQNRPIYLIDDKKAAIQWSKGYAFGGNLSNEDEPTLYTIQVIFNNPMYITTEDQYYEYMDISAIDSFVPELKKLGYDGVIFDKKYNDGVTYYMPINAKAQCKIIKKEIQNTNLYDSYNIKSNLTENKECQIVYHGTNSKFQQFDKSFMDRMDYGYGFYFSIDKQYAKDYGKYLLTCEIPEDKYFLDFDMAWDINEYTQHCLIDLLIHLPHEKQETLEKVMYRDYCNNGFWILEALSKIYGSQEKACQKLRKYGIKGLWSFNGNCYVVFDAQDIKIVKTELNEKYEKHNIFKNLNEQLQVYLTEEAAMLKAPQDTFEQFYNYCIKNPKLQQKIYYQCFDGHIRIPSDTINHAWKKHKTTCEQWLDALSNLTNIQNAAKSKKQIQQKDVYLCRLLAFKDFGIAFMDCPKYLYIMTTFIDNPNTIDSWIYVESGGQLTGKPSASLGDNSSIRRVRPQDSNNIIQYLIEKIKR